MDEITNLSYDVLKYDAEDRLYPPDIRRVVCKGHYRDVPVMLTTLANPVFIADKEVFEKWLSEELLKWAKENWPPK